MKSTLIDYPFVGVLANHIAAFIDEKRAVGRKYNTEGKKLYEFSRITEHMHILPDTLPKELVDIWLAKRPMENARNQYIRFGVIRQFAEYMRRMGYDAYLPTTEDIGKARYDFIPRILTHEEVQRLFSVIDGLTKSKCTISPKYHITMPLIFRLLYCCGLRVSEVVMLHISDVDGANGVLTVVNSKHGKTRYIPLSEELTQRLAVYISSLPKQKQRDDLLFESPYGGPYFTGSLYSEFRKFIDRAGIPHRGKGHGPRLHDLRHTYAVHCLEKWVTEGKDLTNALPRLSAYLGHSDFQCTEPYLRMTSEVFPHISKLLQAQYGYIIPGGSDEEDN